MAVTMSSSSSSSSSSMACPFSQQQEVQNTPKALKEGIYDAETKTITWKLNKKVTVVGYPFGRPEELEGIRERCDVNGLGPIAELIKSANEVWTRTGNGIILPNPRESRFLKLVNMGNGKVQTVFVFDPELTTVVQTFPRCRRDLNALDKPFELKDADLTTPFGSNFLGAMLKKFKCPTSVFNLPHPASQIMDESIRKYMTSWNTHVDFLAQFADDHGFQPLADEQKFVKGYEYVSSVLWKITAHFFLGFEVDKIKEYSYVWNTLFSPDESIFNKGITSQFGLPGLVKYVTDKVQQIVNETKRADEIPSSFIDDKNDLDDYLVPISSNEGMPRTIIHEWIKNDIADKIINNLPEHQRKEVKDLAEKYNISVEVLIYRDNAITSLMVGVQENQALLITQGIYHSSTQKMKSTDDKECKKFIDETMRMSPPAGISRCALMDINIIYKKAQDDLRTYLVHKGEYLTWHAMIVTHMEDFCPSPETFNAKRTGSEKAKAVFPFSKEYHRCPAELFAKALMTAVFKKINEKEYQVSVRVNDADENNKPPYKIAFTLKDGGVEFRLLNKGVPLPTEEGVFEAVFNKFKATWLPF